MSRSPIALLACLTVLLAVPHEAGAHGEKKHQKANLFKVENHFGRTGDPKSVSRRVEVTMNDEMKFVPDEVTINQGETIHFQIVNKGEILHEMVIGSEKELIEHAELMERFPDMEHAEPFMAHVPEQGEGEIYWTFDKPGVFHFGCLIPGHFAAGMRGRIVVTPAADSAVASE